MDEQGLREYVTQIVRELDCHGSFERKNVVIWLAEDGYWVRAGRGVPRGFGWERPAALATFLRCEEEVE